MKNLLEGRPVLKSDKPFISHSQNGNGNGNGFHPLFSDTQKNGARVLNGGLHDGAQEPDDLDHTPQIEIVNRDGKIQRIIITCSCSRRIELECEY